MTIFFLLVTLAWRLIYSHNPIKCNVSMINQLNKYLLKPIKGKKTFLHVYIYPKNVPNCTIRIQKFQLYC